MASDIGSQSALRGHMRLWLRITRFNLDKDAKFAKLLGIQCPRTMEWFVHEALLQQHPSVFGEHFGKMQFPPELPNDYFEPMGIDYGRFKEWENIEVLMHRMQMGIDDAPTHAAVQQPVQPTPVSAVDPTTTTAAPTSPASTGTPSVDVPMPPLAATVVPAPQAESDEPIIPADDESTVDPTIASAAMTSTTVIVPAVGPTSSPTKGDFYCSQANWRRDLGGKTHVSYFNTYLSESKPLSDYQSNHFWTIVSDVATVFGPEAHTPQSLALQVANAWNASHGKMMQSESGSVMGLGGLMRQKHAETLLKERGHEIRAKRALELPAAKTQPPAPTPVAPKRTRMRLDEGAIDDLTYRDCIPWLKKLGIPYAGNTEQKKQKLKDYFKTKPTAHTIEL